MFEAHIQYELQIILYKSRNGCAPQYLYNMLVANSPDSSYNLRNTATDLKAYFRSSFLARARFFAIDILRTNGEYQITF